MGKIADLQVDQHKAFENIVVEHKVNIEIPSVKAYFLLPSLKTKARAPIPTGTSASDQ